MQCPRTSFCGLKITTGGGWTSGSTTPASLRKQLILELEKLKKYSSRMVDHNISVRSLTCGRTRLGYSAGHVYQVLSSADLA